MKSIRDVFSRDLLERIITGGLAGLLAAGPMGLLMIGWQKLLPRREQYALTPEQITEKVIERAGLDDISREKVPRRVVTWLSHFAYGAAAGSLYPLVTGPVKASPVLRGLLFGLVVWAGSYLGWVPAARILPSATQAPARRNLLMIGAHFLWGVLIAFFVSRLEKKPLRL